MNPQLSWTPPLNDEDWLENLLKQQKEMEDENSRRNSFSY